MIIFFWENIKIKILFERKIIFWHFLWIEDLHAPVLRYLVFINYQLTSVINYLLLTRRVIFRINHIFLYFIVHTISNYIINLFRYTDNVPTYIVQDFNVPSIYQLYQCMPIAIRQGRYWQIAKNRFLVSWNGIKMRCSNTVFTLFMKMFRNSG